jgi:hypothetical protein
MAKRGAEYWASWGAAAQPFALPAMELERERRVAA